MNKLESIFRESAEHVQALQRLSQTNPALSERVYKLLMKGMDFKSAMALATSSSFMALRKKPAQKPEPVQPNAPTIDKLPIARLEKEDVGNTETQLDMSRPSLPNPKLSKNDTGNLYTREEAGPAQTRKHALQNHHYNHENNPKYQEWLKKQPPGYLASIGINESRNFKMKNKKARLKEAVHVALLKEQKARRVRPVLLKEVREQIKTKNTAERCLQEMNGLSSVWQGLKSAGSKVGELGQGLASMAGRSDVERAKDERVKKMQDFVFKAIKKAEQSRQKFNSQILKNHQLITDYHESVMRANEVYGKVAPALGAYGQEPNRRIDELINNLRKDLMSEIGQIKTMFANWNLGEIDDSLDKMYKDYQSEVEEDRNKTNVSTAGARQKYGMPRQQSEDPMTTIRNKALKNKHQALRGKADAKPDEPKLPSARGARGKFVPGDVAQRVGQADAVYKQKAKGLLDQMMKAKDPDEKKRITKELYATMKKMKGMGIKDPFAGKNA